MQDPNDDYASLCETSAADPIDSSMGGGLLGGMVEALSDTPEEDVQKLSMDAVLVLRIQLNDQLVSGKAILVDMDDAKLLELQVRWMGPAPPANQFLVPGDKHSKPYTQRQRIALEMRFREHQKQQKLIAEQAHTQEVGACKSWSCQVSHTYGLTIDASDQIYIPSVTLSTG